MTFTIFKGSAGASKLMLARQRLIVWAFLSVPILGISGASNASECSNLFAEAPTLEHVHHSKDYFTQDFLILVRNLRQENIEKTPIKELTVKGIKYQVLGLLGESQGMVYLAKSPAGKKVAIKLQYYKHFWNQMFYEEAITAYYMSRGFDLPKVIATDMGVNPIGRPVSMLVKEYREGVTAPELNDFWSVHFDARDIARLELERKKEVERFRLAHQGFADWLAAHAMKLPEFYGLDDRIRDGDFDQPHAPGSNWLFEVDSQKWIVYDP